MRSKALKSASHALAVGLLSWAGLAQATTVQFDTSMGIFEINLFDETTPETVANFLEYVDSGAYENTFIHRSAPGFVLQGGGYYYDVEEGAVGDIATNPAVVNEPVFSNQRGTIAMAKKGGNPNSATSQWFFNLTDNSANLDNQNQGFTVFGQISEDGLAILDAIAELPRARWEGVGVVPLRGYSEADWDNEEPITNDHLVMIHSTIVLDPRVDTARDLEPVLAIRTEPKKRKRSSGAVDAPFLLLSLMALLFAGVRGSRARV